MSKQLTPFSKEHLDYPTVGSSTKIREGFLDNVKMTKVDKPEMPDGLVKGMEWEKGQGSHSRHGGDDSHPAFRAKDDDGCGDYPAPFSKKNIPGGPKKPRTPA